MKEQCPGGIPTQVIYEALHYTLKDEGPPHTLPGLCVCPSCGRWVAYYGDGKPVRYHKRDVCDGSGCTLDTHPHFDRPSVPLNIVLGEN